MAGVSGERRAGITFGRVALFGGCFDPIHTGHVMVAEGALDAAGLDQVTLAPAGVPPHKRTQDLAPAFHRLRMTQLAVEDNPRLSVWDYEVRRADVSYTIDTVRAWQKQWGASEPAPFLIGADSVRELALWRDVEALFQVCRFIPFARPGFALEPPKELVAKVGARPVEEMLSRVIHIPLVDVSSTEIRRRVAAGRSIRYLAPAPVVSYIEAHQLYRGVSSRTDSAEFRHCRGCVKR